MLVGLLGFIANSAFDTGSNIEGDNLIIFEVNAWHNIVHILSGLLLLSAGFASLRSYIDSANSYFLLQAMVAFIGAASGPIAYSKIVNETFDRHRGIALGLTARTRVRSRRDGRPPARALRAPL